jgi:3-oxoadipate enol-lactonase
MATFDKGSGPPLIVIPGVQGRWEWMRPALDALQTGCRTISYSLCGDAGSEALFDPSLGFDNYLVQLDDVFRKASIDAATLCGVSYGGLIALRYAATRPERVTSLILVSAPAPGWVPNPRQQRYLTRPRASAPLFLLTAPARVWPEIRTALPAWRARLRFAVTHGARILVAPMMPSLVAERVAVQQAIDFSEDPERIRVPTLVVTGDDALDQVVPAEITRRYLSTIHGARYEQLDHTGHIGMLTQPDRFARIVHGFVHADHH